MERNIFSDFIAVKLLTNGPTAINHCARNARQHSNAVVNAEPIRQI